jgi:hypothetical protein
VLTACFISQGANQQPGPPWAGAYSPRMAAPSTAQAATVSTAVVTLLLLAELNAASEVLAPAAPARERDGVTITVRTRRTARPRRGAFKRP